MIGGLQRARKDQLAASYGQQRFQDLQKFTSFLRSDRGDPPESPAQHMEGQDTSEASPSQEGPVTSRSCAFQVSFQGLLSTSGRVTPGHAMPDMAASGSASSRLDV